MVHNEISLPNVRSGMWSRQISRLDWVAIVLAALLAVVTVWAGSYPVPGTDVLYLGLLTWPIVAILWSTTLLASVSDTVARNAGLLLLLGSVLVLFPGVVLIYLMATGGLGLLIGVIIAAGLFGLVAVRSPERRVGWLVAPVIVALTLALLVSGSPRLARMAWAEPHLTAHAEAILRESGGAIAGDRWYDPPIEVGSIPIDGLYMRSGTVYFVTGYVGILADDEAGIAYFPEGISHPLHDHLIGPWYRWYPY